MYIYIYIYIQYHIPNSVAKIARGRLCVLNLHVYVHHHDLLLRWHSDIVLQVVLVKYYLIKCFYLAISPLLLLPADLKSTQ